jgi:D-glycero-D-manno-heptose 1,7-bisphosphate phosphatase
VQRKEGVERINAALLAALPGLAEILVCYHDDRDACACRKPQPGLLLDAASRLGIELTSSFMIGDRWKDIVAGRQAGCLTVWLNNGGREPSPQPSAHYTARSLTEAAQWILSNPGPRYGSYA